MELQDCSVTEAFVKIMNDPLDALEAKHPQEVTRRGSPKMQASSCIVRFSRYYQDHSRAALMFLNNTLVISYVIKDFPQLVEQGRTELWQEKHDPLYLMTDDGIPACNTAACAGHQ